MATVDLEPSLENAFSNIKLVKMNHNPPGYKRQEAIVKFKKWVYGWWGDIRIGQALKTFFLSLFASMLGGLRTFVFYILIMGSFAISLLILLAMLGADEIAGFYRIVIFIIALSVLSFTGRLALEIEYNFEPFLYNRLIKFFRRFSIVRKTQNFIEKYDK